MQIPRREASRRALDKLTEGQWQTLQRATQWMVQLTRLHDLKCDGSARCADADADLVGWLELDETRYSQVLLLDGARGSGKTTLLLTLLKQWSRTLESTIRLPHHHSKRDSGEWAQALTNLKGKLILVPPLDLQPLPGDTDLLTWIASRLFECLELVEGRPPGTTEESPRGLWEAGFDRESDARKAWRDLVQAQAMGGDGNLEARKGSLDAEAYAFEREDAERKRLRVTECWRAFTTHLLVALHKRHPHVVGRDARFVVPIDDADMNPVFCYPLLKLLRVLWAPRVVFVLTGDSGLFRHVIERRVSKKLTGRPQEMMFSALEHLPADIYDKLIPPAHRLSIEEPKFTERLDFQIVVSDGAGRSNDKTWKLNDVLPSVGGDKAYWKNNERLIGDALPATLRRLQDLTTVLGENPPAAGQDGGGKLEVEPNNRRWQELWNLALEANVPPDRLKQLRMDDPTYPSDVLTHLDFTPEAYVYRSKAFAQTTHGGLRTMRLRRIRVSYKDEENASLPDELAHLALVLHDDASTRSSATAGSRRLPRTGEFGLDCALVDNEVTTADGLRGRVPWPMPSGLWMSDYLLLGRLWETTLDRLQPDGCADYMALIDEMARQFLRCVCALGEEDATLPPQVSDWTTIARSVVGLITREAQARSVDGTSPSPIIRRVRPLAIWAKDAAILLATPESGLSADSANAFLEGWESAIEGASLTDDVLSSEGINRIQRIRAMRMGRRSFSSGALPEGDAGGRLSAGLIDRALKQIDDAAQLHNWRGHTDAWETAAPGQGGGPLARAFARITSPVPPPLEAMSLAKYLYTMLDLSEDKRSSGRLVSELSRFSALPKELEVYQEAGKGLADQSMVAIWEAAVERFRDDNSSNIDVAALSYLDGLVYCNEEKLKATLPWENSLGGGEEANARGGFSINLPVVSVSVQGASVGAVPLVEYHGLWEPREGTQQNGKQWPTWLRAIWIVAHDVAADFVDESSEPSIAQKVVFPSVGTCQPGSLPSSPFIFRWPRPRWPAFVDHAWCSVQWSKLAGRGRDEVTKAAEIYREQFKKLGTRFLDALAYATICGTIDVFVRRRVDPMMEKLDFALSEDSWRELFKRLWGVIDEHWQRRGRRVDAFFRWAGELALMATPEAGLSSKVAGWILEALVNRMGLVLASPREESPTASIRDADSIRPQLLRRLLMTADDLPEAVASRLAQLDTSSRTADQAALDVIHVYAPAYVFYLHALRRKTMKENEWSTQEVNTILKDIDSAASDHPWVKHIEKNSAFKAHGVGARRNT